MKPENDISVLAFGEILWDIIEGKEYLGGAPLNFAAHFAQCRGKAAILSRIGNDAFGLRAVEAITSKGVDINFIQTDPIYPTGMVDVKLISGQPQYAIKEGSAYDFIDAPALPILEYNSFYFGTLAQRNEVSRKALHSVLTNNTFREVFYDVNLRMEYFSKSQIYYSLEKTTILKLNNEEALQLGSLLFQKTMSNDEFTKSVLNHFNKITLILLTQGSKGCKIYDRSTSFEIAAERVEVKDTVGAGDSFSAAFLKSYLSGIPSRESAEIATKVAGYVAGCQGPIPTYSNDIAQRVS